MNGDALYDRLTRQLPAVSSMGVCLFDPIYAEQPHLSHGCELIHVISGSVELVYGGCRLAAGPGDTLLVPSDTEHQDIFDLDVGLKVFIIHFTWTGETELFARLRPEALGALAPSARDPIQRIFEHIQADFRGDAPADRLLAAARVLTILLLMLRAAEERASLPDAAPAGGRRAAEWMRRAKAYIDAHYDKPLSVDVIADAIGVSSFHLSHVFSRESDFSLYQYLTAVRMNRAKRWLAETDLPVGQIARRVGYSSSNYFTKAFRRCFGAPPSDYR